MLLVTVDQRVLLQTSKDFPRQTLVGRVRTDPAADRTGTVEQGGLGTGTGDRPRQSSRWQGTVRPNLCPGSVSRVKLADAGYLGDGGTLMTGIGGLA